MSPMTIFLVEAVPVLYIYPSHKTRVAAATEATGFHRGVVGMSCG